MRVQSTLFGLLIYLGSAYAARETLEEAAVHARDLIDRRSDGLGTLMSVFPSDYYDKELENLPIGGLEYFAANDDGDLIILAMPISKQIHNIIDSPTHNVTVAIKDEYAYRKQGAFGSTDRNRLTVFGYMEALTAEEDIKAAAKTFGSVHKDARIYFPPNGAHKAYWAIVHVEKLYWIGGFGDTHYIGWIPVDLYRDATSTEDYKYRQRGSRLFYQAGLN